MRRGIKTQLVSRLFEDAKLLADLTETAAGDAVLVGGAAVPILATDRADYEVAIRIVSETSPFASGGCELVVRSE